MVVVLCNLGSFGVVVTGNQATKTPEHLSLEQTKRHVTGNRIIVCMRLLESPTECPVS